MKRWIIALICLVTVLPLSATHNRAGEIVYRYVGDGTNLTYEFTVITYTKLSPPSDAADRPRIALDYGDGTVDSLDRVFQQLIEGSVNDQTDIFRNEYRGIHTYPGPFTYVVTFIDPNRVADIINIATSVDIPFSVSDTVKILDPNFFGVNNSPVLLQAPIDNAAIGIPFIHNPNAFDPDGDSLSYELIVPQQAAGVPVPSYAFPDQVVPGPDNQISIDQRTGEITWDAPQQVGLYNIAILIREFRNGLCVGTITRDMQIRVDDTPNNPPVIDGPEEICIIAGDTLSFLVTASDEDELQEVELTAGGSPFQVSVQPAFFDEPAPGNPVTGEFYWETLCDHIRANNYQVIFRAADDFTEFPLSSILTTVIRVLAPPPDSLTGEYIPQTDAVVLNWSAEYACSSMELFRGYQVWRKVGCEGDPQQECADDLAARGYVLIGETTLNTFTDTDFIRGNEYSYRVAAKFAELSNIGGIELNPFIGYPSVEFCVEFPKDLPVMYNVDVRRTDLLEGEIYVEWSLPDITDLDTLLSPGPYRMDLMRADGIEGTAHSLVASFTSETFSGLKDTFHLDGGLNTVAGGYNYMVDFYVAEDELLGSTDRASSVFLTITERNEALDLKWEYLVPWTNDTFLIHRQDFLTGNFVLIDTVLENSYRDLNLLNDSTYCYLIESIGRYSADGYKEPLVNLSQEVCAVPNDTFPPCLIDSISIRNFCTDTVLPKDQFINFISWTYPPDCPQTDDIVGFYVYFAETGSGELTLLDSTVDQTYIHLREDSSLTGCYVIQGRDEAGNLGPLTYRACVADCPIYVLPTAFTPDGDGWNDVYTPVLPFQLVARVDMKIFNRWGNLVHETEDPGIHWDGTDVKTGKMLDTAVFYYICKVYVNTLEGLEPLPEILQGYIHLYR